MAAVLGRVLNWVVRRVPRPIVQRFAKIGGRILAFFYKGFRYCDPLDGFKYRALLPYGRLSSRRNALAPAALSLERHRLIWLWLTRVYHLKDRVNCGSPVRVLHVAPEPCLQRALRSIEGLVYTSADLESPWATVHCNIENMPFEDESFDLILCNHVLEHVENDRQAMAELFRVLSSQGVALLLVPLDSERAETLENPAYSTPALREKYYGQADHVRLYGRDYFNRLQSVGFHVAAVDFYNGLSEHERQYYALRAEDTIYLGGKHPLASEWTVNNVAWEASHQSQCHYD